MNGKSRWIIILFFIVITFLYMCLSCIFYMKCSDTLMQISKYQVDIMKSGFTIQKLVIISGLFFIFINIFFISILMNMGYKLKDYEEKIESLRLEIINRQLQNDNKENIFEDKQIRKSIAMPSDYIKDKVIEIEKLLEVIKNEKDRQMENVSMFIKTSSEGIRTTEEIYNNVNFFQNSESSLNDLNIKIKALKDMANDIAINAAIENTKISKMGAESKGLLAVSDASRRISDNINSIFTDMETLNQEVNDKKNKVSKVADKIKNIYITQEGISRETKNQFDILINRLDESLNGISGIVNEFSNLK